MKKKLKIIFLALILGGCFALITLLKFSSFKSVPQLYQLGVYKNLDNAEKMADELPGAIILKNEDTYQVIGAIARSQVSKEKIENLLSKENLNYYKKPINLTSDELQMVDDYELMIEKVSDYDTLKLLNEQLLKKLEERMK